MNSFEKRVVVGLVIGVLIYAGIGAYVDAQALVQHMTSMPLAIFSAALGLSVVNYTFRWLKYEWFLRVLGIELPKGLSALTFVAGLSMSITPGKVGEVLKSMLLRDARGIPVARTAPIVLAERLTDLLGLLVIAAFGVGTFAYGEAGLIAALVLIAGVVGVVQSPRAVHGALELFSKVSLVARFRPKLEEAYEASRALLHPRVLLPAGILSVISWSCEAFAFYLILDALGSSAGILLVSFIYATCTTLGGLSFLPGGLGVTEGSMIGALLVLGACTEQAQAAAATYLIRFATLWFGVVLGFVALAVFRLRYSKSP